MSARSRTARENQQLAEKIRLNLHTQIVTATTRTIVRDDFLAGLISVENAQLNPHASRYEAHVFRQLCNVRSNARFWNRTYNGVTQKQLRGMSDDAVANLARSWGLTQVMAYHTINNLRDESGNPITVAELRGSRHLHYAVQFMSRSDVAMRQLKNHDYPGVLRIWNTGSPTGKTHDAYYVQNALGVMKAYQRF